MHKKLLLAIVIPGLLAGCNSDDASSESRPQRPVLEVIEGKVGEQRVNYFSDLNKRNGQQTFRFAVTSDSQEGRLNNVTVGPVTLMQATNDKIIEENVDIMIASGDITNNAWRAEFDGWLDSYAPFLEQGHIYPVRGNHERNNVNSNPHGEKNYREKLGHLFSGDEVECMEANKCLSYSVIRENVLFIALDEYYLGWTDEWAEQGPWLEEQVNKHKDAVDHIVVFHHEPLVSRGHSTVGSAYARWPKYDLKERLDKLYTENNIISITGHNHIYARSEVFTRPYDFTAPSFSHIISGHSGFKAGGVGAGVIEFAEKSFATDGNAMRSGGKDYMATTLIIFEVNGQELSYKYWKAPHKFTNNIEDKWEAEWFVGDQFNYTKDSDRFIFGPNDRLQAESQTPDLKGYYGSSARILDGFNHTFDSIIARGFSWNDSESDLSYTVEAGTEFDLNLLLAMSWFADPHADIETDVVLIDGLNQQDGTLRGWAGEISENDRARYSTGNATGIIDTDQVDPFVLAIRVPEWTDGAQAKMARRVNTDYQSVVTEPCRVDGEYQQSYLYSAPNGNAKCNGRSWGYDADREELWAILNQEGAYALIQES